MVIHYNIDNICDIIKSEEFISNYNKLSKYDEKKKR